PSSWSRPERQRKHRMTCCRISLSCSPYCRRRGATTISSSKPARKATRFRGGPVIYAKYKDKLWESFRTMERRIAAYRRDPSVGTTKAGNGSNRPKHLTPLEHKLLGTATCVREVIVDLRAGRTDEAIAKLDDNTPTQDRIT